ncbi:hypothetical protein GGR50DRAFT_336217 [Xylaria sp. CBS 124048]|nr:hypothetical protein GGR50DRAFT_336217 [Xylaria sp. CBS 124048]
MLTPPHRSAQRRAPAHTAAPPAFAPPDTGRNLQRDPAYDRPVSSIYSHPSTETVYAINQPGNNAARHETLEVSPPSSPDINSSRERPDPGDVSPIEESPDAFHSDQARHATPAKAEPKSNIPMMRRERRKNTDAAMSSVRETRLRDRSTPSQIAQSDIRWDPRTGEPTTSEKGRPSQVKPQEYAHGLANRTDTSYTPSKSPQPNPASLRDRLRPVRQTSVSPRPEPAPRPEWRGGSGRTAVVPPVFDDKNAAPLNIPRRRSKSGSRAPLGLSPAESNESGVASSLLKTTTPRAPSSGHDTAAFSAAGPIARDPKQPPGIAFSHHPSPVVSAYPTPPYTENTDRPGQLPVQTTPSKLPPLQIPSNDKAIRRKPARAASAQHLDSSTSAERSPRDDATSKLPASGPPEWTQPQSRFSISTYATSDGAATPRVSPGDSPQLTPSQSNTPTIRVPAQSILDRGRPMVSGYEKSPSPKPVEPVKISLDSSYYLTAHSTVSTKGLSALAPRPPPDEIHPALRGTSDSAPEKSLPPAPPEALAKDRVAELNAQLEALGNRRININTAIRQMTEMMPTDNVLASEAVVRKREEEKRKVETLRTELAEVERQSYELGLRLHRAYKRLDRDAEYEPTGLWVRRVTN